MRLLNISILVASRCFWSPDPFWFMHALYNIIILFFIRKALTGPDLGGAWRNRPKQAPGRSLAGAHTGRARQELAGARQELGRSLAGVKQEPGTGRSAG
jgi:hypothetical protein